MYSTVARSSTMLRSPVSHCTSSGVGGMPRTLSTSLHPTGIRSEGLEQYEKIKAQTDRERAQLLAEAERKAAELRGGAEAEASRIYSEAYAQDPEFYDFLSRLKVLEQTIGERSTWILPHDHELLRVLEAPEAAKPAPKPAGKDGKQ